MSQDIIDIETINNESVISSSPILDSSKITKKKKVISISELRLRNKLAARKSRQKKVKQIYELEKRVKELEQENKINYDLIYELQVRNRKLLIKNKSLRNNIYVCNSLSKKLSSN